MSTIFQKRLKYASLWLLILVFGLLTLCSKAQALIAPQVYFTELNLSKNHFEPGETVEGAVSLWNYEEFLVSDLRFHFQLLGEEVNGVATQMIDEQISKDIFSLSAGEKATKSFSYTLPSNLPQGDFKFRIQLATSRGEEMGWIDKVISVGGEGVFLIIDNYWIVKEGEDLSAGGGVSYEPGEIPQVRFDVTNDSQFSITAFPKLITYKRNVGQFLQEKKEESIILNPGEKETLRAFFPELTEPESYLSEVRFYDSETEEPISNSIYFRWIISGEDAEILYTELDKGSYETGEEAEVKVQYTGPPDYEVEGGEGKIEIELFNGEGKLVGKAEKEVEIKTGEVVMSVPLTEKVDNPKVETKIVKEGRVLDEYAFQALPGKEEREEPKKPGFFQRHRKSLIGGLVGALVAMAIAYYLSKKKRFSKTLMLAILMGLGVLFGAPIILAATEVTGGFCDTTIVFNSPIPQKTYDIGDIINFSGKFRVTGCGDGLFFNKIEFFVTEDKEIPIIDRNCCGDCCGGSSSYYSCYSMSWCSNVQILDTLQPGYKTHKLGTIYPADVGLGANPYWVEYNQIFVIPEDLGFSGPVRLYVQYSGTHWNSHWHWNITYQKGFIEAPNNPPTAKISCDPPGCAVYAGDILTLLNQSTDPEGQDDIAKSEWDILNWGDDPDLSCSGLCNFTPQARILGPGNYTAELYVEDKKGLSGLSGTSTKNFSIKKDATAGFMCSLDNSSWQECENLNAAIEEVVYFKDHASLSEHSEASGGVVVPGASITSRTWKLNGVVFSSGNETNPSVNLTERSNTVELIIQDSAEREANASHIISATLALPEWQEIPPF